MAAKDITTSFLAYHYPALQSGVFSIEQEIRMSSGLSDKNAEIPVAKQYFVVAGERFYIAPDQVFATFPPKDSEGDYTGCLPHIELKRSTLPWERNALKDRNEVTNETRMPWLALLLVSEKEIEQKSIVPATVKVGEYISKYGLSKEQVTIQDITELDILKCSKEYLEQLMPAAADMKLLSHVRKVLHKDKVAMAHVPEERAIIVSGRMPQAGNKYTAHLISLEERYENGQFKYTEPEQEEWLISLYSWRFTTIDTENYKPDALALSRWKAMADTDGGLEKLQLQKKHFEKIYEVLSRNLLQYGNAPLFRSSESFKAWLKEEHIFPGEIDNIITAPVLAYFRYEAATLRSLLNNLNAGPFRLTVPQNMAANDPVAGYLNFGSVPLPHHLRAGGHTASWYRGPFIALDAVFEDDKDRALTHRHADELIQFNKDTGLLDMSYAAAWELGRLMFINEPKLLQQLQLWKQENNFDEILEKERKDHAHLVGFIPRPKNERLPAPVVHFLLQSFRFINFPFNYLVPDSRLLPPESLRFFKVDDTWLRSFLYGVISIGEKISYEKTGKIIRNIREELNTEISSIIKEQDYYINEEQGMYGILMHSDAVSGWPALQIEAYRSNADSRKGKQIALLHKSYLADNIILCLFYGRMEQIVIHLPMGASHFGLGLDKESDSYIKTSANGKMTVPLSDAGTIDIAGLASKLTVSTSGDLAIELLHKQDMVTFDIVTL